MDKKLLKKIKELGDSSDVEMRDLSRLLFWQNSPEFEDLVYVEGGARFSVESFLVMKSSGGLYLSVPGTIGHLYRTMEYVKAEKFICIRAQAFQDAARLRDVEKKLLNDIESRKPWKSTK